MHVRVFKTILSLFQVDTADISIVEIEKSLTDPIPFSVIE